MLLNKTFFIVCLKRPPLKRRSFYFYTLTSMDTNILIDGSAYIPISIADEEEIEYQLSFDNPDYLNKVRFGSKFGEMPPKYLSMWSKTHKYYIVPRNFPITFIRKEFRSNYNTEWDTAKAPINTAAEFTATLRPYQEVFTKTITPLFTDVLIQAPCGHGKTIIAIHRAVKVLKQKTVVLVNTNFLADQWEVSILKTTSNLRVTKVTAKRVLTFDNLLSTDIMVITNDLLLSITNILNSMSDARARFRDIDEVLKRYNTKDPLLLLQRSFGHVILDEYHRFGALSWSTAIGFFHAHYRTTCTATPRRGDDRFRLLDWSTGERFVMQNQFEPAYIYGLRTNVTIHPRITDKAENKLRDIKEPIADFKLKLKRFYSWLESIDALVGSDRVDIDAAFSALSESKTKSKTLDKKDFVSFERCLTFIAEGLTATNIDTELVYDTRRSKILVSVISRALEAGRTVLVLSKRRDMLLNYTELFQKKGYKACAVVGNTKDKKSLLEFANKEAQVIFGIVQLAQEGLDIDRLDTLICVHPLGDLEQAVGRTIRVVKGKKQPLVIIPVDDNSLCTGQFYKGLIHKGHAEFKGILNSQHDIVWE